MTVFELARLRRPALVAEYLLWCTPLIAGEMTAMMNTRHMSRERLVESILIAQETGGCRR